MKKKLLLVIILIVLSVCGYELYMSNYGLTVSNYTVSDSRIEEDIRMVVLADLHNREFGENNQRLISLVKEQNPDIIMCVGDFVNGDEKDIQVAQNVLKELLKIAPIYFSNGNHEIEHEETFQSDLRQTFEATGATVLEYNYEDVEVSGQKLRIGGLYGYCVPAKYLKTGEASPEECEFLEDFMDTDKYTILLCHMPCIWSAGEGLEEWDIDMVLSGHAHGGQIRIPFVGGLYAPDQGWFPGEVSGQYVSKDGTRTMILSRGLGSSMWIPRFNNIPEVVVVDLKSMK